LAGGREQKKKRGSEEEKKLRVTVKLTANTREGARRKNGYEFDSRGLIHQTLGGIASAGA